MKQRNLLTIAVCGVLLTACIPSVHAFYTDKDLVFDARLLGEWQKKGATGPLGVWKFEQTAVEAVKLHA